MKRCSRLGIAVCFDKDGIIDDYIPYLLNDIKENLDRLVIVVNGMLTPGGRDRLHEISKDVVVRENSGYDAAAFKFAMTEYLGWEEIKKYDELVLLNDTFFGPFYPFQRVFEVMAEKNVDFWGLSAHGKGKDALVGNYKRHLQSYFLVVRKSMHSSFEFQKYWDNQEEYETLIDVVLNHEAEFTEYFEKRGFTWESYIDMTDLDGDHAMNHYAFNAEEMLKRGFPILKRKQFQEEMYGTIQYHNGEDYRKAVQYIKKHYRYDIGLIWQNILRLYNIGIIHDSLALDYVVNDSKCRAEKAVQGRSAVVVLHMYYTQRWEHYEQYIRAIPEWMDVVITTVSKDREEFIQNTFGQILGNRLTLLRMKNHGRDLAAMLVVAKPFILKYDYFCFCHDKISSQTQFSIGKYFDRLLWENTLASTDYIENIISLFQSEPQLGILTVPYPIGGFVAGYEGKFWMNNYDNTVALLKKLDITVPIEASVAPLTLGTAFWGRTTALKKLLDHEWEYTDFPKEPMGLDGQISHALERCFSYVAQDAGYYTAVVMTPECAGILVNAYKYLAFHPVNNNYERNYMCYTESDMPNVGVQGAWHLLKLTLRQYFKKTGRKKTDNESLGMYKNKKKETNR